MFLVGGDHDEVPEGIARIVADQAIALVDRLVGGPAVARHRHPAGIDEDPAFLALVADDGGEHGQGDLVDRGDPDAMLKNLLPSSPAWDFEMNLFTFTPGAALPLVEVHVMEHGLIFLQGGGIYRLDDCWYSVQAGDVLWMGPFCPQ